MISWTNTQREIRTKLHREKRRGVLIHKVDLIAAMVYSESGRWKRGLSVLFDRDHLDAADPTAP